MFEHEGAHMLAVDPNRLNCGSPGADEILHSFLALIGNPYHRLFVRAQQSSQRKSIPPVCLHPIARFPRDQRRATTMHSWPSDRISR